ncbi:MAG: NAD(P)/FAD-dependent oxidoreductase [Candidatus Riflebacteria bacterium]|nr:NAD(P)/FAD-dependent oxidoreductase [Candidatus Riflebacteria bacterium]
MQSHDVIVVGGGPAGMMAAITAARQGRAVLLLEKLPRPGAKLEASGGGRCNLTNTLDDEAFRARFGRAAGFLIPALAAFDHHDLLAFFAGLGVACHAPDGFHVFPVTHRAGTVVEALTAEMARLGITVTRGRRVTGLRRDDRRVTGVLADGPVAVRETAASRPHPWRPGGPFDGVSAGPLPSREEAVARGLPRRPEGPSDGMTDGHPGRVFLAPHVVLATGGLGYPALGAEGDGYALARQAGHTVTDLFPAMLPLRVRETWVRNCRADTIGKAVVRIVRPRGAPLQATGDLIFTADGIRGPVVLDLAREVTPLLAAHGEVPLRVNLVQGRDEEEARAALDAARRRAPQAPLADLLNALVPAPLALELCRLAGCEPGAPVPRVPGEARDRLLKLLVATPLTVVGHDGFPAAMITRGGVSRKEIRPETLESRLLPGLFFAGELVDLDGPCGGFNLQWAFSSGFLAGHLGAPPPRATPQTRARP